MTYGIDAAIEFIYCCCGSQAIAEYIFGKCRNTLNPLSMSSEYGRLVQGRVMPMNQQG